MHAIARLAPIAVLLLSACGESGPRPVARVVSVPVSPPMRPPATRPTPPKPQFRVLPGLEGVIGASEASLVGQFGKPRLNVWEGDARKLQFTGPSCVLDIYLYPPSAGAEPQASYAEARRASDGREVDRTACIAALRKR